MGTPKSSRLELGRILRIVLLVGAIYAMGRLVSAQSVPASRPSAETPKTQAADPATLEELANFLCDAACRFGVGNLDVMLRENLGTRGRPLGPSLSMIAAEELRGSWRQLTALLEGIERAGEGLLCTEFAAVPVPDEEELWRFGATITIEKEGGHASAWEGLVRVLAVLAAIPPGSGFETAAVWARSLPNASDGSARTEVGLLLLVSGNASIAADRLTALASLLARVPGLFRVTLETPVEAVPGRWLGDLRMRLRHDGARRSSGRIASPPRLR